MLRKFGIVNLFVGIATFFIGVAFAAVLSTPVVSNESEDIRLQNSTVVIRTRECKPVAPQTEGNELDLERLAELNTEILEIESTLAELKRVNSSRSEREDLILRIRILKLEIKLKELQLELEVEREKGNVAPSEKLLYRELCYEN